MTESNRLKELYSYDILDSPADQELSELAEIASVICDTPISLVTFVDEHRQWFKAAKGLNISETARKDSFCQHSFHQANEVFVVEDSLNDPRFADNALVVGDPNIRFYAGAPLETPNGHILGTLCVIDNKPRKISPAQKRALQLLAKKAMDFLNSRKLIAEQNGIIEFNASRLKKLTDHIPGIIYQLEMNSEGRLSFSFVSRRIMELDSALTPEVLKNDPEKLYSLIHPEDLENFQTSIRKSFQEASNWTHEFRIITKNNGMKWLLGTSNVERTSTGTVIWYGNFIDTTSKKEYISTLEQILFDISHVIRRPVATMLGLIDLIEHEHLDETTIKEYAGYLKTISEEMDGFVRTLNDSYSNSYQIMKDTEDENFFYKVIAE